MTRDDRTWELLQSRWAAGETLTAAENTTRLDLARQDPLRMGELEVSGQLRQYLEGPALDLVEPSFADTVLERARLQRAPHLRLVTPGGGGAAAPVPSGLRARLRFRPWHAALGVAALAAGAALLLYSGEPEIEAGLPPLSAVERRSLRAGDVLARSELVFVSGEVKLDRDLVELGKRTLEGGERLTTEQGRACLTVEPRIDVCLDSESSVVLESLREREVRIRVLRGRAVAALGPRQPGHSFALSDGDIEAVARGTIFALTKGSERKLTKVTVIEGQVEVSRERNHSTMVRAHSELQLGESGPLRSASISRNQEAQFLSLVAPRELWQRGELGVLSVGGAEGVEVMIGGEGPFALPVSTFVPAGSQRVLLRDASGAESLLDVDVRVGEVERVQAAVPEPARRAAVEKQDAGELLGDARAALKRGDSKSALGAYRRLRALYPNSPEAFTVLVTVGKLELKQNSPARALSAFDSYLRRGGPLSPEALAGKIRAHRALGQQAAERQAIERYLREYPEGFEAVALKQRLELLSKR